MPTDYATIDYKNEVLRKAIHLCSLSIPVIYYHITKELALSILTPLLVISLIIDLGRYYVKPVSDFFYKIFGFLLRNHEKDHTTKRLNGATYVLISAVIVVSVFPKVIAVTAFAVLIIGDIAAALVGRKFGHTPLLKKSLEGTFAFFFFSGLVVLFTPKVTGGVAEYFIGFAAVAVGAVVENLSAGFLDDNLTIPISVGVVMWILYAVLFPDMSLILHNVPY
ncbi:phosphatidate cytidylyltransferase [Melioribacter roseus P3M-2]|uniref:Phosphatidate cytidylyltransferase n=1 Tax=Melioribacter roseus (strain DSM 23840 / JCM 17771 / VKM B-2668 / P3M-2) TaxID=1191523 RepID=I6ZX91_MELRP|nr:diacylglycerol/polyprenol kinase family protein [Melioribacter roseus]AFN73678.1 phosphatidate cytidylyltransferase [Melioribacter roseus P3M-2]